MSRENARRRVVVAVVLAVVLAAGAPVATAGVGDDSDGGVGDALNSSDAPRAGAGGANGTESGADGGPADSDDETANPDVPASPDSNVTNASEADAADAQASNGTGGSGPDDGGSAGAGSTDADGPGSSDRDGSDAPQRSEPNDDPIEAVNGSVDSAGETIDGPAASERPDPSGLGSSTVGAAVEGLTDGDAPAGVDGATDIAAAGVTVPTDRTVDAVGSTVDAVAPLSGTGAALAGTVADPSDAPDRTADTADADRSTDRRTAGPAAAVTGAESEDLLSGVVPASGAGAGDGTPAPGPAGVAVGAGAVAAAAAVRSGVLPGTNAGLGATLAGALAPLAGRSSALLDRVTRLFAPLRYSRYDDSDPLEHEAREEVFGVVEERPGAYLSEVAERAGLPLSTARHHVRVLEREDIVSGVKVRGKRRFYPAHTSTVELTAALNDEATAAVLDALARLGAASVSDLADELGRDPSTISHHLQRLAAAELIVRERDGRAVMNRLAPEARTALDPEAGIERRPAEEAVAGHAD